MSANVETMFSVRETPWHGLGTIIQEAPTSADALRLAGLDWTVQQVPAVYNEQGTGYFFNVRNSDDKVLGVVGSRYKPVQNADAFSFVDELLGEGVTYETAGSLATGKRVWMLAKMPEHKILDDAVEPYLCLTNSHDGYGSLKVCMTPVRVVCQNTLNLALSSAKRNWNIRHTTNVNSRVAEAATTLRLAQDYMSSLSDAAEDLYSIKVSAIGFHDLAEKLFPVRAEDGKRKEEAQIRLRDQLKTAWNMDDLGNIRGTGWGFLNAVSDMTTHRPPARKVENYQENMFMATIDAPALLDQALQLLKARV